MVYTVYSITHIANGKRYIGRTQQKVNARWCCHKRQAIRHPSKFKSRFHDAIREFGSQAFKVEILEAFPTLEEADQFEIESIKKYQTRNPEFGYNIDVGGAIAENNRVRVYTDEMRKNISVAAALSAPKRYTEETRKKISKASKGRVWTEESRAKISALHKGRKLSPERCEAIARIRRESNH